jgi:adenosylmethionine-8-amino-7-oxononanoate aminotransferase
MSKYQILPWNRAPFDDFIKVEKTEGHHLYTSAGDKLLDYTYSIAFTLGYNNKEIIDEIYNELMTVSRCQVSRGYTTDSIEEMSDWLCETGEWAGYSWSVTGTGAVECAISMVDTYWKNLRRKDKFKIITFPSGWHGTSYLTKSMAVPSEMNYLSNRCVHIGGPSWRLIQDREKDEARILNKVIEKLSQPNNNIGCILFDPCPWFLTAEFSENFWRRIRKICDEYDVLMVTDDVATGFGKLGAIHTHTVKGAGVRADISALGKAITAGHAPLSAAVCNLKVKNMIAKDFGYGHTYLPYMGGIGAMRAVKRIYERDKILERVPKINQWLNKMGDDLLQNGLIRSYRTAGVMMSLDLTENYKARTQHKYGLSGKLQSFPNLYLCAPLIADETYMGEVTSKFTDIFSK